MRNNVRLTERQRDVLELFLQGKTQKQIGADLRMHPSTVGTHLISIRKKFGVRSNRALYAMSAGGRNVGAELATLRADVAGLERWRQVLVKEIAFATAQRDAAMRELQEIKSRPDVQLCLRRRG